MADEDDILDFIPDDELEDAVPLPSNTYRIDFENRRILGRIDGIEAVKQAILKAVITPRFKCLIYDDDYGSEIKNDLIKDTENDNLYWKAVIPEYVKDSLSLDDRVLEVKDFDFDINGDTITIKFTAVTIFGDVAIEGVI